MSAFAFDPLDHVPLEQRPIGESALVSQLGQIEGAIVAMDDQLGHAPADRRSLLQAVAREAVAEVEVLVSAGEADDRGHAAPSRCDGR